MIDQFLADALHRVAGAPILVVAADYDGTLAEIVGDPEAAVPHLGALGALVHLGGLRGTEVAIVSGRSREALARLTGAPAGVRLIGTHGAEWGEGDLADDAGVDAAVAALRAIADRFVGTVIEEKPRGAALHYRHARDREGAAAAAIDAGNESGARVIHGKEVVEVLLGDADKGTAIERLRTETGADAVVFLGDDTTDEDVFARLGPTDVGVKVGPGPTAAPHRVADPGEVAELLELLTERRSEG